MMSFRYILALKGGSGQIQRINTLKYLNGALNSLLKINFKNGNAFSVVLACFGLTCEHKFIVSLWSHA